MCSHTYRVLFKHRYKKLCLLVHHTVKDAAVKSFANRSLEVLAGHMSIGHVVRHILYLDRAGTHTGAVQVKVLKSNLGFDPVPNHMLIGCNPEQGLTFGNPDVRGFTPDPQSQLASSSTARSNPVNRSKSEYTEAFINPVGTPGPKEKKEYSKHVIMNKLVENIERGRNLLTVYEVCFVFAYNGHL